MQIIINKTKIVFKNKESLSVDRQLKVFYDRIGKKCYFKRFTLSQAIIINDKSKNKFAKLKYFTEGKNILNIFGNIKKINKKIIRIFFENKEKFLIKKIKVRDGIHIAKIKIILLEYIVNFESLFRGCNSLISIKIKSDSHKKLIKGIKKLFCGCSSLVELPKTFKCEISDVNDISEIFSDCSSLNSIPDISKWKVNNVKNMEKIFPKRSPSKHSPDLTKLDTSNVEDIINFFMDVPH